MLVNQKRHSTLDSITTEKMSKFLMQHQLANMHNHDFNIHEKKIIIEQLRNIRTASTETLKKKTKTAKRLLDNET